MASIEDAIKRFEKLQSELGRQTIVDLWERSGGAKRLGEELINRLRTRTRLGKGVEKGKNKTLTIIEPATIKARTRYKKNLSPLTRPKKSNLTATGQMLDSISYKYFKGVFTIFFKGKRNRELSGPGSSKTNATVGKWANQARPFFGFSDTEYSGLAKKLKGEFLKIIRSIK